PRIDSLRIPFFKSQDEGPTESGFWHAIAFGVMKRPVIVAVVVIAFLLLLGAPFLRLSPSKQDARALDEAEEPRRVSDILNTEFLPHETTPHLLVFESPQAELTAERVGQLYDYVGEIA